MVLIASAEAVEVGFAGQVASEAANLDAAFLPGAAGIAEEGVDADLAGELNGFAGAGVWAPFSV